MSERAAAGEPAGIPTPDPPTFWTSFELLSSWLEEMQPPLVLGGFSQGAVMSWALALGRGQAKRPAAILAATTVSRLDR